MRPFDDGETRFCTARAMAIAVEDASGGNPPVGFHSRKRPERRRPRSFAGYLVVMVLVLVIVACGPRQSGQRTERTEPSAPTASTVWRTQAPPEQPVGAEFGDRLQLVSAKLREPRIVPGEPLVVELTWRSLQPIDADLRAFIELLDEQGEEVAGDDDVIGTRANPTSGWAPGAEGLHQPRVTVSSRAQAKTLKLRAGVLDTDRVSRLPVTQRAGFETEEDSVMIAEFQAE
jgi:hypothetical protein